MNTSSIFSYFVVILLSSLTLASLFFALPKTEKIQLFGEQRFDLNKKEDSYWKEEFILELKIQPKDRAVRSKKIEDTKNIIYRRLRKAGVEEIQILNHEYEREIPEAMEEEENFIKEYLKVTVQTSKDKQLISRILTSRGYLRIVTKQEHLDTLADADKLQLYLPENYDDTPWTRHEFRTILIKKLVNADGGRSYFAIFKPWMTNRGAFEEFLTNLEGETIGISMNQLITPIEVREDSSKLFAWGIGDSDDDAFFYDVVLNTGVVPVDFMSVERNEKTPDIFEIDHVQVTLAILVSMLILIGFLYTREKERKEDVYQFAFSMILLFSLSFTILKIWQIPVDLFLLIPASVLTIVYAKVLYFSEYDCRKITLFALVIAGIMFLLGTGYIPILGKHLFFAIILFFFVQYLTKEYFKHIKVLNS